MPFPSTKVIHSKWSERHQPTAQGGMTATCEITEPGTGEPAFDNTTGAMTIPDPTVVYTGVCRVQGDFRPSDVVTADQQTATRRYLVALPAGTTGVRERLTVKILTAPHALQAVGRELTVQAIEHANEEFELDLICIEAQFQGTPG